MALSIQELEAQLLEAKKAQRTTAKTMRYKEVTAAINPAADALAAAQGYKDTLINDVRVINNNLIALANESNVKYKAIVNQVNALNELIADASESEYESLIAQIESLRGNAELLKLSDYTQDYRFGKYKQDRNVAVAALAAHLNVITALEAVCND